MELLCGRRESLGMYYCSSTLRMHTQIYIHVHVPIYNVILHVHVATCSYMADTKKEAQIESGACKKET